jgi:hypothetical protein
MSYIISIKSFKAKLYYNYNIMPEDITNFHCKTCNKYYSSYQSLWIHNKKFHHTNVNDNVTDVKVGVKDIVKDNKKCERKYICDMCQKEFSCRQSKYEHKKMYVKKNT